MSEKLGYYKEGGYKKYRYWCRKCEEFFVSKIPPKKANRCPRCGSFDNYEYAPYKKKIQKVPIADFSPEEQEQIMWDRKGQEEGEKIQQPGNFTSPLAEEIWNELDEIDREILAIKLENFRSLDCDSAERLGISKSAFSYRLRRLMKNIVKILDRKGIKASDLFPYLSRQLKKLRSDIENLKSA